MSKAILEFDAPESCDACREIEIINCKHKKYPVYYTISRHPDCPLRIEEDKLDKLRNGIIELAKSVYSQEFDDGKNDSPSFEDGFESDLHLEITELLEDL